MYEKFHQYLTVSKIPLLEVWGKKGIPLLIRSHSVPEKICQNARIIMIDAGYFAVESHTESIAVEILDFLKDNKI
jgi:hypothetical protein